MHAYDQPVQGCIYYVVIIMLHNYYYHHLCNKIK